MNVIEFGIVIEARELQYDNTNYPIDVTEFGIVIETRD